MWIDCEDKMPPEDLDVLVIGDVPQIVVPKYGAHWYAVLCRSRDTWMQNGFDGDRWAGLPPKYWMRLPEPPK